MMIAFWRIARFAIQNFWRNAWLSFVTISILTLTLLSVNFFIASNALLEHALGAVEQKINVTIYFQQTAQDADIQNFMAALSALPEIASKNVRTRDAALETFRTEFQNDAHIQESLKELEQNPLPASVIVRAKDITGYDAILAFINNPAYETIIERRTFEDRTKFIERIRDLKANMQVIGSGVIAFFAVIAVLIVLNTIRMTIYTRRREVGIMKLVGATNRFIRAPLFLEAIIYSIVSVALTILIIFPLLSSIQPYVNQLTEGALFDIIAYFSANFSAIFGSQLLAIMTLNVFSSFIAIGRYLKV